MTLEKIYELYLAYPAICIDTRKEVENTLFFCLKGDNFDGNKFADAATEKGAAAVFIDNPEYATSKTILVEDVLKTLQQLANFHRQQFTFPLIGLTGSNGKTTTKELIAAVLRKKYRTAFTAGNFNNHIGVPLTLLSVSADAEMAVIEMGANHQGEIRELCRIADPDFGYITNIGKAHLEGFGGLEGVKKGKLELFDHIRQKSGTVFVNADDPVLYEASDDLNRIMFGTGSDNFVSGTSATTAGQLSVRWQQGDYTSPPVKSALTGNYNATNILAAICIGRHFGVSAEDINAAIEAYTPGNSRSQIERTGKNTLILDCYNANPTSMEEALKNLAAMEGKKLAVLGHMLEIGDSSQEEHQHIIQLCQKLQLEAVLVGPGYKSCELYSFPYFPDVSELRNWLVNQNFTNYTVLLKGSRGIKMEQARDLF